MVKYKRNENLSVDAQRVEDESNLQKRKVDNTWLEAFLYKIEHLASGRCGLAQFSAYLEQLDSIEDLIPLAVTIKSCDVQINVFLQLLKESDDGLFLLPTDPKDLLLEDYDVYRREMKSAKISSTSDIAMAYGLYKLEQLAWETVYEAFGLLMKKAAELQMSKKFTVSKELLKYLDLHFLGRLYGNTDIPPETKMIQQFIVRGNLAGIGQEDAEQIIALAVDVVKWGYFYEHFEMSEACEQYEKALGKFLPVYAMMNKRIRDILYPAR